MARPKDRWTTGLSYYEIKAVRHFLAHGNQQQAYIAMGRTAHAAQKNAHRFFNRPHIVAAIETGRSEHIETSKINPTWVLQRLFEKHEANIADLYDDDGFIKHPKDWPRVWQRGLVTQVVMEEKQTQDGLQCRVIGVKLANRERLLDQIGNHVAVQAFRENKALSSPSGGPVETVDVAEMAKLSDEELTQLERARAIMDRVNGRQAVLTDGRDDPSGEGEEG